MVDERFVLVVGALLHDIGKFIQRGKGMYTKRHEEYSKEFVLNNLPSLSQEEKEVIADLVGSHHKKDYRGKNEKLLRILKKADGLSAAHDRMKFETVEEHVINGTPLKSVICELFKKELKGEVPDLSHPLVGVSTELRHMAPREKESVGSLDYQRLYNGFEEDMRAIEKKEGKSLVNTLNYLLMKWTRFVPSAVYLDVPDIPLYDHLKTTAAIALSLYEGKRNNPFLFIMGDVSGIQNFIFYNYSSENVDEHATKRMRGRSLMINLLVDAAVKHLLERLSLYEFNVMWSSGGQFLIMAPNTEENRREIEEIKRDINLYIREKFERLSLVISTYETDARGIEDFPTTLRDIHISLEEEKSRKHAPIWNDIPIVERIDSGREICPSCGLPKDSDENRCQVCLDLERLGGLITKGRRLVRRYGEEEKGDWRFEFGEHNVSYRIVKKGEIDPDEHGDVFLINDTDFVMEGAQTSGFKFWGVYVPRKDGIILSLNELLAVKDRENGAPLAVFKGDVDFLGLIFSEGLKGSKETISRITFLSFLLDLFFSVGVREIAEKHEVYVVFSGGDDLTAAGRYDKVFQFGAEVNREFKMWMGMHPYIHLSGGYALAHPKFPLRRLVEYAETSLEEAKGRKAEVFLKGKNSITAFGTTTSWKVLEKQLEFSKVLHKVYSEGRISAGFGHFLLTLKRNAVEDGTLPKKGRPLLFRDPLLRYYLVRNWKGKREDIEDFVKLIEGYWDGIDIGTQYWILNRRFEIEGGER